MKLNILKGTTSKIVEVFIQDSSSSVGAGLTGLVFNSAGLTAYYALNGAASGATVHTLATMTIGTWASGGFVEKDATNMPGIYQLGVFNAALTGADSVVIYLKGATNMAPAVLEIQLVDYDPNDTVRLGLTALPNVAAGSAGGLPDDTDANGAVRIVDGTGAREINTNAGAIALVDTCTTNTDMRGTDNAALQTTADAIETDTQNIQSRLPTALIGGRMDSDVEAINNSTTAAVQLALSANEIESGACEGTPSTTVIQTDLAETQDDIYIGRTVIFTSGNARGEATDITDYTGSTGTLTVTALANAPAASDTFILL